MAKRKLHDRVAARESRQRAVDEEETARRATPMSADDFRRLMTCLTQPMVDPPYVRLTLGGYSLPRGAVEEFVETVCAALSGLIGGEVLFNVTARDREAAATKQRTANADVGFQTFLACSIAASGQVDAEE